MPNAVPLWGIAFTAGGGLPRDRDRIVGWLTDDAGNVLLWHDRYEALAVLDLRGWTGYVCEYPSGKRS